MTAPAHPQHAPAPHAYVSPIPVRRAHLGDALASEWTKIRSVRSTMWTLGVMILLMVVIGLGVAAIASSAEAPMGEETALAFGFFGMLPASICVITLGVLTIASEYGTGMIRTTLTACPSRARVLTAKAIVFFLLVFTVTTVVATLVALAQVALVDAAEPSADEWLRATVGAGAYLAALGLLSLAIGTLIRHSAGAITVMIGLLLLPLVAALFMFSAALKSVQEWLFTYAIPSQMIALYSSQPPFGEDGPAGWEPLLIMGGTAAVVLAGAYALLNSRDV
ncbi:MULTISPECIES: ABC transporter permease subunit [Streptomyces]|uniref:ABC transporter n=1 Tax=Streptomyces cinereoruber TaxID=67260 RepID=A0AAV4KAX3_9ACTN|nr:MULTISPECIES: ABC transporter permease subunit [Streptomyces]AVH95436.1 ABC transporter permease [Streptomyces sp. WAC00288]KYG54119.1 ABC transporter [Streptomyces sp. WAC04657]MBB4158593.1 ABC-type transport system involved in multi-copper enzyme maturation permease subunit [Streptomyces cinereoruber]MBY8814546.1 ABC transporter permease [Streptomyces cinereoruber]NIH59254.1 ABC-type transport system involved in multi-copper enzyme maturation permease subunit [Streptomyces cinereoruber]